MLRAIALVLLLLCNYSAWATNYFITTTGSDAANGLTTGTAWASPNHAVNCGDVLTASSGTYSTGQFTFNKWGAVSGCSTGTSANVATVICATPFACNVTETSLPAFGVTNSFWRVSGFTATVTSGQAICFEAYPAAGTQIHHIIFDNDIANGCFGAGFQPVPFSGTVGVDYFIAIGSIAYNAAKQTTQCGSGFDVFEPVQSDTLSGTHIYFSQDFAWANINGGTSGTNCAGGAPTDGEGFIFDTWDGLSYTQQGAMENNISMYNGNTGLRVDLTTQSHTYIQNNTSFGNEQDSSVAGSEFGEIYIQEGNNTTAQFNIVQTNVNTVGGFGIYALGLSFFTQTTGQGTNTVNNNQGYSPYGHFTICSGTCTGFSFGGGNTSTNPSFASPPGSVPAAPNCTGFATVPACMATIIADFVPSSPTNAAWGYQAPTTSYVPDALFPVWLCNVSLPANLISTPCAPVQGTSTLSGAKISGGSLQ